jgi:hypothetical protein
LEKAAKRVRDCGNYLIFARGERGGYTKVMVTARTADFQFLKFKGAAEKIADGEPERRRGGQGDPRQRPGDGLGGGVGFDNSS